MDLLKALRELYLEKSRVDRLIAICESKTKELDRRLSRSKRGRKSMSTDERKVVSERMRTYWANRRTEKMLAKVEEPAPEPNEEVPLEYGESSSGTGFLPEMAARAASTS